MIETASLHVWNAVKRRSKMEIYMDVLRIINHGVNKPTRIMYAANISWKNLTDILSDLEKRGLIRRRIVGDRSVVLITERGKDLLRAFESVSAELAFINR